MTINYPNHIQNIPGFMNISYIYMPSTLTVLTQSFSIPVSFTMLIKSHFCHNDLVTLIRSISSVYVWEW